MAGTLGQSVSAGASPRGAVGPLAPCAAHLLGSGVSAAPPPAWEADATRTLSALGRAGLLGCGQRRGGSSRLSSPDTVSHTQGCGQTGQWRLRPALAQPPGFGTWSHGEPGIGVPFRGGSRAPGGKRATPAGICVSSQCGTEICPTLPSSQPRWDSVSPKGSLHLSLPPPCARAFALHLPGPRLPAFLPTG